MDDMIKKSVNIASEKYKKTSSFVIKYGTAGFRAKSSELDYILYRMGLLAAMRSMSKNGSCIGMMITASHNPEDDNGVKLIDPMGEMLAAEWETYASRLARVSEDQLAEVMQEIIDSASIKINSNTTVAIARDTRSSSLRLSEAAISGINALGAKCINYGLLTTPQLHYMVRCINSGDAYGKPTESGYYNKLATAFVKLTQDTSDARNYSARICIDGANGIGALKLVALRESLKGVISIDIYNDGSSGQLNHMCGADYVKVQQKVPEGLPMKPFDRYASFDGDADRIVYFYTDGDGKFHLLDGDKVATLVASYLKELVAASGLELKFGLVQTAYANGSSTHYISEQLQVEVACVPTGVKHLHHAACSFDIGVYFEANGHGTVLFSEAAMKRINQVACDQSSSAATRDAATRLVNVIDVINQTVGDAISDMLLVEMILSTRGWSIVDWNNTYTDLPNRQLKVKVADRNVIQTTDAERRCTSPNGLQSVIDDIVSKYKQARSFVRPSGTEDLVRVYAEADTQDNVDALAEEVSKAVYRMAGGVDGS